MLSLERGRGTTLCGVNGNGLHDRLNAAVGDRTYRHIGEITQTHPETVRRYMQGQSPSVEFVAALAAALGLSGDWILTGRGAMKLDEARTHQLHESSAGELLSAVAGNLERLMERVERLEQYTQILETRLRGSLHNADSRTPEQLASAKHDQSPALVQQASRAQYLADALARRSPPDAR